MNQNAEHDKEDFEDTESNSGEETQESPDFEESDESEQEGFDEDDAQDLVEDEDSFADGKQEQRIKSLEAELERTKDHMLRALAEAENARKRALKDREEAGKYAISAFARDLLIFADNFVRAQESIPQELIEDDERITNVLSGIQSMEKDLLSTFEKHGIEKIHPEGEKFDPNFHEVMFETPGTGQPAGTVIQVIEPGYMIKDRLLRPARVGIAKDDGTGASDPNDPGSHIDTEA